MMRQYYGATLFFSLTDQSTFGQSDRWPAVISLLPAATNRQTMWTTSKSIIQSVQTLQTWLLDKNADFSPHFLSISVLLWDCGIELGFPSLPLDFSWHDMAGCELFSPTRLNFSPFLVVLLYSVAAETDRTRNFDTILMLILLQSLNRYWDWYRYLELARDWYWY